VRRQGFSGKVLGDVKSFTSGVTNRTNPVPGLSEAAVAVAVSTAAAVVACAAPAPAAPAPVRVAQVMDL